MQDKEIVRTEERGIWKKTIPNSETRPGKKEKKKDTPRGSQYREESLKKRGVEEKKKRFAGLKGKGENKNHKVHFNEQTEGGRNRPIGLTVKSWVVVGQNGGKKKSDAIKRRRKKKSGLTPDFQKIPRPTKKKRKTGKIYRREMEKSPKNGERGEKERDIGGEKKNEVTPVTGKTWGAPIKSQTQFPRVWSKWMGLKKINQNRATILRELMPRRGEKNPNVGKKRPQRKKKQNVGGGKIQAEAAKKKLEKKEREGGSRRQDQRKSKNGNGAV